MWPSVTVQIVQSELYKTSGELLGNKQVFHVKRIWEDFVAPAATGDSPPTPRSWCAVLLCPHFQHLLQ